MTATYHGRPCRHGHTLRYSSDGHCIECNRARSRKATHTPESWERRLARQRAHYANLSGPAYNHLLLKHRRTKALGRMAGRNEGRPVG